MLQIGTEIPRDTDTFRDALIRGLAPLGLNESAVSLNGDFPQFAHLSISLSDARFDRGVADKFAVGESRQQLCFSRNARFSGRPVFVKDIPLTVELDVEDLVIASGETAHGRTLAIERVSKGTLDVSAQKSDLESALFALGDAAAKSKGAELQGVALTLENESPRALAIRAVVTAKAMFFTTTVTVSGRLTVDDTLTARLSGLDCEGDGMIGKMAASALRDQFQKLESQAIQLGRAFGGMRLSDIEITGGDALRVRARLGAS